MDDCDKQIEEYTGNIVYTYDKNVQALKGLWEEAFDDSEEFVEYYFSKICKNNKVLSAYAGDRLIGMIHLNPYDVFVGGKLKKSYFVVGVAVTYSMRQKGIMKSMMNRVFSDVSSEGVEFVFLMPALEDYYFNLGYKKIYDAKNMNFTIIDPEGLERDISDCYASLMLCTQHMSEMSEEDIVDMADITNQQLAINYSVFCRRSKQYMENMIEEHKSESGDVCIVTEHMMSEVEDDTEDKNVVGIFSYGIDDDTMYVERFEPFVDNSMALMISVLKMAVELSCARCVITVAAKDVDGYEHIFEGIDLDISDSNGIMACVLTGDKEKFLDVMVDKTFIDEIV